MLAGAGVVAQRVATNIISLLAVYGLSQHKTEIREGFNNSLLQLTRSDWIDKDSIGANLKFVLESEAKIAQLNALNPGHDERCAALLILLVHFLRLLNEGQPSHCLDNFRNAMNLLFDMPTSRHAPIPLHTIGALKSQLSKDYPQIFYGKSDKYLSVGNQLNMYCAELANYLASMAAHPKPAPLLLMGPPGVGKTRFVEQVLAPQFDLPVVRVSLAHKKRSELAGQTSANLCNAYDEGILFRELLKHSRQQGGKVPIIVFFDDICTAFTKDAQTIEEREVLSWLTEILSRDSIKINLYNRYPGINGITLNLKHFIFIAAANSIHFLSTPGMKRRFASNVQFPKMGLTKKQEIANVHIEKLEATSISQVNARDLPSAERESELKKVTLSEGDKKTVLAIAKLDPHPGASVMKDVLNQFYAAKKMGIAFDPQKYYASKKSAEPASPTAFTPAYRDLSGREHKRIHRDTSAKEGKKAVGQASSEKMDQLKELMASMSLEEFQAFKSDFQKAKLKLK